MSPSIKNLRRAVVAGGVILLAVVAVFFGIARLKGRHFGFDLPGHLGVDISQTANGFTYSQSQKGHTLFTIHASKLVQYKGDQAELHDVTITLYGPEGSGRSDKIYGSDFLYDRKQGIARATGTVRIDFAAPAGKPDQTTLTEAQGSTVHVTTSGVVFNQASGEASTDQRVDFALTRATGSSIGAQYNAKDGVLVLDSQVALTTEPGPGQGPAAETTIHAAHAQLLRDTHVAYLIEDTADTAGRHTRSDEATINFRPDGSAQHIDQRGHVYITTEDGAQVHAGDAATDLDPQSRPLTTNLNGGVTYYSSDAARTMQGTAVSATLRFVSVAGPPAEAGAKPVTREDLHHAQFRDAVSFVLQQHSLNGDPNGSATRQFAAGTVDIDFAPGAGGKAEAQHVLGTGGATAVLHDVAAKGPSKQTTVSGDQLLATLADGHIFKLLDGKGNTKLVDSSSDGATSTGTGDTLHVTFIAPGAQAAGEGASARVDTAVQSGNVVILQVPAPAPAAKKDAPPPLPLHATAARAEYKSDGELLHLSGDPHLRNDTLTLSAEAVDYHRDTGDASAMGNVKATYEQQPSRKTSGASLGGNGPVHVTADHAQLTRYNNISIFYGSSGVAPTLARMWQGGDAVTAPVIELNRDEQTLDAHGERGGSDRGPVVHATLGARSTENASAGKAGKPDSARNDAPTRLTSVTLHYSDKDHRADLRGAVTAEQPAGTIHADQAQVYLTPGGPNQASQLDHLVATGHVVIVQPGRRGTGEELVYTAADSRYVLTGTPAQPPRMTDSQKGTTTGAALIFKSADDSVEVSNHVDSATGQGADKRAHTVTDTHTQN